MLRYVLYDLTLFDDADQIDRTRADLCWLMEALTQRNMDYLRARPNTPRLYKSGVVYQMPAQFDGETEEVSILRKALGSAAKQRDVARVLDLMQQVFGGERFRDIGRVLENGGGDCDNLAAWRAAEWRMAGIPAQATLTHREGPNGNTIYHALVRVPPIGNSSAGLSTFEDPSLLLGMGGPARAADRAKQIQWNQERCDALRAMRGGTSASAGADADADLNKALSEVLGVRAAL